MNRDGSMWRIGLALTIGFAIVRAPVHAQYIGPRTVHFSGTPGFEVEGIYNDFGDSLVVALSGIRVSEAPSTFDLRVRTAQGTLGVDWSWGSRRSDWIEVRVGDSVRVSLPGSFRYVRDSGVQAEWLAVEARLGERESVVHAHARFTLERSDRPLGVPQDETDFLRAVLTHSFLSDFRFAIAENSDLDTALQSAMALEGWRHCRPCPDSDLEQPSVYFSDYKSLAGDTLEIATSRHWPSSMGRWDLMIGYRDGSGSLVVRPRYRMIADLVRGVVEGSQPSFCCPPQ